MKIVKFKDGKYGVRRLTLFGYKYKDFRVVPFWWSRNSRFLLLALNQQIVTQRYMKHATYVAGFLDGS